MSRDDGGLALDERTCLHCGLPGSHEHWKECIAALRDKARGRGVERDGASKNPSHVENPSLARTSTA
jgi:hypothetical protein